MAYIMPLDGPEIRLREPFNSSDVEALRARYLAAKPFPHLVIDDLFPAGLLNAIEAEFDQLGPADLITARQALHRKSGTAQNVDLPPSAQRYFDLIYSGPFLRFLSKITGIDNLIPDPALFGGGMHEIHQKGCFDVHIDFRKHPDNGLDTRLVLLTYLNRDWKEAFGGMFELWRLKPASRVVSILPEFGRTVLMHQSRLAAHGHPVPVATPDGRTRRSLAAYFYTNGREDDAVDTEMDSKYTVRITRYVHRPGRTLQQKLELFARQVAPPIMLTGLLTLHRKFTGQKSIRR